MDALTILREFTSNQQLDAVNVTSDANGGGRVKFGDKYDFDKDIPITRLSDREGKPTTLEGLVYLAFNAENMGRYAAQCRDFGIPLIDIKARVVSGRLQACHHHHHHHQQQQQQHSGSHVC
jgi:hypothetical protein